MGPGPLELALTVELPLIGVAWPAWQTWRRGTEGFDLAIFRHAAAVLVHRRDPDVHPTVAVLAQNDHYVYPAPFAYLFAPFVLESRELPRSAFCSSRSGASSLRFASSTCVTRASTDCRS